MRTLQGLTDTLTGIIISQKDDKEPREIAKCIIEMLFEEDNLVLPPKQDYDLTLKRFNDFLKWHKAQWYVSIKKGDFEEWLNQL